ncbi:MAG: DUF4198 domain-containing protein [Deltaproteobacteria bacterium]|nr:DUF4198 domain-containing protein [Deltaproteobacteria bacterium]
MRTLPPLFQLLCLLAFSAPGWSHAHGVFHQIAKKEAVVISAEFDDGEPMSYADVKIHSPTGGQVEYQNGRTDRNGRFAFVPDQPGDWRIHIDAGMGHSIEAKFTVDASLQAQETGTAGGRVSRWHGILTGVSLIVGLTGLACFLRTRRSDETPSRQSTQK